MSLYCYANQISDKEVLVGKSTVNENGDFEISFDITRTDYVFCHTGVFFLYMFVEPERDYTITLPSRIDLIEK